MQKDVVFFQTIDMRKEHRNNGEHYGYKTERRDITKIEKEFQPWYLLLYGLLNVA